MIPEISRQYVPEGIILSPKKSKARPGADQLVRRNGLDKNTLNLVADTINAGSNMFTAQEAGDKEAEVLFKALIKWGGCRDDIYYACRDKEVNRKLPLYFQTFYPEYLYFFAQDAKKNPFDTVEFPLNKNDLEHISLKKSDLLRLILSYSNRPLMEKRIPLGI